MGMARGLSYAQSELIKLCGYHFYTIMRPFLVSKSSIPTSVLK